LSVDHLREALGAVDWTSLASKFLAAPDAATRVDAAASRIAVWARQIEESDAGNPALPFVREMQISVHNVTTLIALSLYKAAPGSLRALFENALYYSYFRTHRIELATLVREKSFYISKSYIMDYYRDHVPDFQRKQERLGFVGAIKDWYSEVSAAVHAQKPGTWTTARSIAEIDIDPATLAHTLDQFERCVTLVDMMLKICVAPDVWDRFSTTAKRQLLKGMPGEHKALLQLDSA